LPRDNRIINKSRASLGKRGERYHIDQRFQKFVPGKLSQHLLKALGLSSRGVPLHIYKMRLFGYPPAWLEDAKISASNLRIIGTASYDKTTCNKLIIDKKRLHDFPGYNVPLNDNQIDEHRRFNAPPMLPVHSKEAFISHLNLTVAQDSVNKQPMEVEINENNSPEVDGNESPTLGELRETQLKLLTELNESNGMATSSALTPNESNADLAQCRSNALSTTVGTPVLESVSRFQQLPSGESFSAGVSDVIHFENLPNSTGKYEKMRTVLSKVRKTLLDGMD